MVKFEYSKDFKIWVGNINGKRIEDYTVLGSFDIRQGYNLSEEPRASTFSMDIVSDYALAHDLLEYKFIRIYKNTELVFVGQLSLESKRKIETLTQQVLSIKYIHLLDSLTNKVFTDYFGEEEWTLVEGDGYKVLDSANRSRSLVHVLIDKWLIPSGNNPFGMVFDEKGFSIPTPVIQFGIHKNDNIWKVLNDLLREYGYIIRIENTTIYLVDILEDAQTGIELLDGADIHAQTSDEELTVPDVLYLDSVTDKGTTLYKEKGSYSGWLFGDNVFVADLPFTFEREGDNVRVINVSNVKYKNSRLASMWWGQSYVNEDLRSYHRVINRPPFSFYQEFTETVTADVTYSVYRHAVSYSKVPAGFSYAMHRTVQPRYLYTKEQVERYLRAYAMIKMFKKTEWTFYSKRKLNVDDIVRFKDIPETTCRIFEVKDTLEADGGYTYKAFPFSLGDVEFEEAQIPATPGQANYITDIYSKENITIENQMYRKPSWRVYIKTALSLNPPTATANDVPQTVGFDDDAASWYFDIELKDVDLDSLTVEAKLGDASLIEVIPIFKIDNRPTITEYRYSTSPSDPNADDFRLFYGKYALMYADAFLGGSSELWTEFIPEGEKYQNMYLWKRTWNYTLNDWVYEMLTPIIKQLGIYTDKDSYIISRRNVAETAINVAVVAKGYGDAKIELLTDGGVLEAIDSSHWTLKLPVRFSEESVTLTAKVREDETKKNLIGIVKEDTPIYHGILGDAPSGVGAIDGDYYLTAEGVPMRWNGSAWVAAKKTDKNFTEILETVGKDWINKGNDITEVTSAMYAYFGAVYSTTVVSDHIVSRNLEVGDGKKFLFKVADKENGNAIPPVFDVKYNNGSGLNTIFKVDPASGRVFLGEPNEKLDRAKTGFMYDPDTEALIGPDGKFQILSNGGLGGDAVQFFSQIYDASFAFNKVFLTEEEQVLLQKTPYDDATKFVKTVNDMFDKYAKYVVPVSTKAYSSDPDGRVLRFWAIDEYHSPKTSEFNEVHYIVTKQNNLSQETYYYIGFRDNTKTYMVAIKDNNSSLAVWTEQAPSQFLYKVSAISTTNSIFGDLDIRGNLFASNLKTDSYYNDIEPDPAVIEWTKKRLSIRLGKFLIYVVELGRHGRGKAEFSWYTFPTVFKKPPLVFTNFFKSDSPSSSNAYGFIQEVNTREVKYSVYDTFTQELLIIGEIDENVLEVDRW